MKKLTVVLLVLLFVCILAVPAYAASFYLSDNYNESCYELIDNCTTSTFNSTTLCDSNTYLLKSDVSLFGPIYDQYGGLVERGEVFRVYGTSSPRASTNSGNFSVQADTLRCKHYVDGNLVYTANVSVG